MEVGMSLNALVRLPLSNSRFHDDAAPMIIRHSLFSSRKQQQQQQSYKVPQRHQVFVVEAKGKKGMIYVDYIFLLVLTFKKSNSNILAKVSKQFHTYLCNGSYLVV